MDEIGWALWGLAGAFGYAAPRMVASLFDPPDGNRRSGKAFAEFLVAVSAGPIAAAGLGPVLAIDFFGTTTAQCRAAALVIGLIVNPVAPSAVELFSNLVLARLGHPLKARKKTP